MRLIATIALVVGIATPALPVSVSHQTAIDAASLRPEPLRAGQRVDVQLDDGSHIFGTVASLLTNGFYVEQGPRGLFVKYPDVFVIRDHDTGVIVLFARQRAQHWKAPVLIGVTAAIALILRYVWTGFEQ
jgi:hypothetical protein